MEKTLQLTKQQYFDLSMAAAEKLDNQGESAKAVKIWQELFDKGYSIPGFYLGVAYYNGKGVDKDWNKAFRYMRVAAECAFPEALHALAFFYEKGIGIKQNAELSFQLYMQGLEAGWEEDYYEVARCYHQGIGVEKDDAKALEYLQMGAKTGEIRANVGLGHYYLNQKEGAKAYPYFRKAAEGGSAHALYVQAQLTRDGEGVAAPDYKAALPMFQKAAELGNHDALGDMGYIYEEGVVVKQDYKKAVEYYEKAIAAGNVLANVNLGLAYANGRGVPKDLQKAGELFKTAAQEEEPAGIYYYGMMIFYGEGGKKQDFYKAFNYVKKAAELGEGYAYNALSVMYEKGLGVKANLRLAKKYHKLAEKADCLEDLEIPKKISRPNTLKMFME